MSRAEGARAVPMVARLRGISHCYEQGKNSNSPHYGKIRRLYQKRKRRNSCDKKQKRKREERGKIKRNEGGLKSAQRNFPPFGVTISPTFHLLPLELGILGLLGLIGLIGIIWDYY